MRREQVHHSCTELPDWLVGSPTIASWESTYEPLLFSSLDVCERTINFFTSLL